MPSKSDQEKLKKDLKLRNEILKLMDSYPRLRIILVLLMFRKLSLSKLSQILERSKATTTKHIKSLNKFNIIKISTKEARGSIDANVYELIPDFLTKLNLDINNYLDLPQEQRREIFHHAISSERLMFKLMQRIFEQADLFYEAIDERNLDPKFLAFKDFIISQLKPPISYDFWFLSEKGLKSYEKLITEFNSKMNEIVQQEDENNNKLERSYLISHSFFPLLKMTNYDSEMKKFCQFFGALGNLS